MGDVVTGVVIVRVHGQLLRATQHQHRRTVQHQRPQGAQFCFGQRVEGLVGADCRQDAQRVAFGMVQQCSAGHREVGDAPGARQVAEVDGTLQLPLALVVAGPHGVVVGDVQVHGLGWQPLCQGREALAGQARGLFDAGALRGVVQYRQQVRDQRLGMLRVPLQGTHQAWMVEVDQGLVEPCAQPAQFSHQARRHVLETRHWLAVNVVEQAYPQGLPVDGHCQQGVTILCRLHGGHRHALLAQVGEGGVLRLQFDLGVAAVTGLEHEAALRGVHAQVQVLLAAQRRQVAIQAVMRPQQRMRLSFAKRRAGQGGALDQRVEGRGGGVFLWAGHELYRCCRG